MMTETGITVGKIVRQLQAELTPLYGAGEAKAMVRLIFHALKGWSLTDMVIHEDSPLSEYMAGKINGIKLRLLNNEPIQYVLGEAYFYGLNLKVTADTLIPRPETEQLVDMIVKDNEESDLNVLDIGTGSGAIAIALARNLRFPQVSAIDISEGALKTAKENADSLHAKVDFISADIFTYSPIPDSLNIIVSNPPYIDESEKSSMEKNVLDYEPHTALFVPDSNPLIYYSRIAEIGSYALRHGGKLYFEINPRHAGDIVELLQKKGYKDIETINDLHGKIRFVKCKK